MKNSFNPEDLPCDLSEHRFYDLVLKMVLWGDSREKIHRRLAVNKVDVETIDRLYAHARRDRIRTIRQDCRRVCGLGLSLSVASSLVIWGFFFGLGFIPRVLLILCFAVLAYGLWKFVDGLSGYLMAGKKQGSVADD